jgi:undecaprenyl-diphosphatase
MSLIEALILGFVQGITEFLPISSTAHIVITSYLLDLSFDGLTFEIFLHLASALAVIIYFRKDLMRVIVGFFAYFKHKTEDNRVQFRFGTYIIIATIVTGVLGVLFKDLISDSIKTPPVIAGSLFVTGLFLIFIERVHKLGNKDESTMTWRDTFVVAIGQTLAVLPGISRSGATLVASLLSGLNRETAVRFSFLLAIPAILGSTILELNNFSVHLVQEAGAGPLIVAFIASFLFSIIGIIWLIDFLKKSKLIYFAIYCIALAVFVLIFFESSTVIDIQ